MSEHAYKFTDEHVRRDPRGLSFTAESYLRKYCGEFPLLVQYKHLLERGGSLTIPMIRATLNCMRFDAASEVLLPASENVISIDFVDRIKMEHKPSRPICIEVVAKKWNTPYGIGTSKNAVAVHILSPESGWRVYTDKQRWVPRVRWLCKPWHAMPGRGEKPAIELLDEVSATFLATSQAGWRWCQSCQRRSDNNPD